MRYGNVVLAFSSLVMIAAGPVDPGPKGGPPHAGGPLSNADQTIFGEGKDAFEEIEDVSRGIGPRFNELSCGSCHAFPATGGTSPPVNPQVATATKDGATNVVPSFITSNGPVREARFILPPLTIKNGKDKNVGHGNGQNKHDDLDGGVHDLFVISGRTDAPGCNIEQPDFATELSRKNVIFRIPTPTFGLGLVEDIPDDVLEANAVTDKKLGISPHFNHSGNDGTITKFGWKAQNKSLLIFSGEAYNVEQGVTNALFPNERETEPTCQFNQTPEDTENDVAKFADFMRLTAPPTPFPFSVSASRGQTVFSSVGCAACHVPSQTTHAGVTFSPYSDFSLHPMGDGLADGILQGNASGDEFRTAPLWGASQRLFFLHDGRTSDLYQAILMHDSKGSQAGKVIQQFKALPVADQQAILDFLRSL
jgi:CxxC motif-containing protein (DUF1111 family)